MCAVFFIGKIDTVYENINQITVVFQTINVALNKVVEKENYFKELSLREVKNYPMISLGRETMTYKFYNSVFLSHGRSPAGAFSCLPYLR